MLNRLSQTFLVITVVLLSAPASRLHAQDGRPIRPPREFIELRGAWMLDESAGKGHIAGLPVARTITISTTPVEISVVKDANEPEVYRVDGTEVAARDIKTGVVLDKRYSFTLVAGMVALTSKRTNGNFTNIITDAYAATGDTLTVERQLSVLTRPQGSLVTLSDDRNNRQTLVYRRSK